MPKLFVALDLPADARAALVRLQPPSMSGIRLPDPGQMHLTLHYLGEADLDRISASLQTVDVPAFALTLEGVGQFPSAGGTLTLWAGVRVTPGLSNLHAAIATALAGEKFRREDRPYTPHVTLARCEAGIPIRI